MTIRTRLTLAMVAVVVAATVVLGWVTVTRTEASLVAQVDDLLRATNERPVPGRFDGPFHGGGRGPSGREPLEVDGAERYSPTAELVVVGGELRVVAAAGFPDDPEPLPRFDADDLDEALLRPVTVGSVDGDDRQRMVAQRLPGDAVLVRATSLTDVDAAVDSLVRTLVWTATAVLLVAGAVAWWVVRRGLKPIDTMIDTAGAIAAGDLARRVDHADDGTELGRLASAIDHMLERLEDAFADRDRTEERLRRFVSDASHELRTPVSTIRGYAELHRQGGLTDDAALERAMERIETESVRMGGLVQDLLDLARLDRAEPLGSAPVDLAAIATDAVADLRVADPGRPVSLDVDQVPEVPGDADRLRQVVANLLDNARTHTPPEASVAVTVSADAEGARLVVADEGPGIAADHLPRIFERFYRADESRTRATGGSGLGLSIVAAIVEAHGGTISVDSIVGAGTTFTVHLPFRTDGALDGTDRAR